MSRFVFVSPLAGIWGGVGGADNTQNINTSTRAQAEPAIIMTFWWPVGDVSLLWFMLLQHISALPAWHEKTTCCLKAAAVCKSLNTRLHLLLIYESFEIKYWINHSVNKWSENGINSFITWKAVALNSLFMLQICISNWQNIFMIY